MVPILNSLDIESLDIESLDMDLSGDVISGGVIPAHSLRRRDPAQSRIQSRQSRRQRIVPAPQRTPTHGDRRMKRPPP